MGRGTIGFFGCLMVLFFFLVGTTAAQDITLVRGQQKTIDAPDMNRIAVGNPRIADVKALKGQILVTAIDTGQTDIIIWDKKDKQRSVKVQVVENDPRIVAKEISQLLKGVEGIKVSALKSKVVIQGKALRKEDLNVINQITELYPQATNLATLSPAVLNTISEHLNIELKQAGMKNVEAERLGNQIVVQGEVASKDEKEKIDIIASAFEVKVKNLVKIGVSLKNMVLVNVDFVEMKKDDMIEAGFKWNESIGIGADASGSAPLGPAEDHSFKGTYSVKSSYGVTLQMVKKNKDAHIIARPKLLCRSGEKAEFLAGGEIPIKVATLAMISVEYKKFGILLNIAPEVDNNGNIATSIEVENSTIADFYDGTPAFQSSRVKTNINLKSGEVIVLSGLVNREHGKAVQKIPLLGSIPILGELFKSRSFKENKTELVIFVSPVILSPGDPENKRLIQHAENKNKSVEDEFKFKLLD